MVKFQSGFCAPEKNSFIPDKLIIHQSCVRAKFSVKRGVKEAPGLLCPLEADVVRHNCCRSHRYQLGRVNTKPGEGDLFAPYLSEEILEETDGEELARATAIPEAEWSI